MSWITIRKYQFNTNSGFATVRIFKHGPCSDPRQTMFLLVGRLVMTAKLIPIDISGSFFCSPVVVEPCPRSRRNAAATSTPLPHWPWNQQIHHSFQARHHCRRLLRMTPSRRLHSDSIPFANDTSKFPLAGYAMLFSKDGYLYYQDGNGSPVKFNPH